MPSPDHSQLVLLSTSPRVAPGPLSWPAWRALHAATRIVVREPACALVPYVEAAGLVVERVEASGERELAGRLVDLARDASVVYLTGPDGDPDLGPELAAVLGPLAERGQAPEVEVLPGTWDLPGSRLLDLVAVMDRLRSPGGCPWDAEQTHESLVRYLLEETYETVETIEAGDLTGLKEELGDLLLQVVFHARIGEEHAEQPWSIDDVSAGIVDKLVRRHPHVFADATAPTTASVEASWEQLKAAEKGRTSAVEGIPLAQPALSLAAALMSRAERAGVAVEVAEPDAGSEDIGELLLGVVAAARRRGIDAEAALRSAARHYAEQVRAAQLAQAGQG